jgi:hypothetical protein
MRRFNLLEWIVVVGILLVAISVWAANTDTNNNLIQNGMNFTHISTNTSTAVDAAGPGFFHSINVNTEVASETIKIYDVATATCNTHETTGVIAKITIPATVTAIDPFTMTFDVAVVNGLCVETSSTADITVSAR